MNEILGIQFSGGFKPRLNKVKASGRCHDFSEVVFRASSKKIGRKYAKAHLITNLKPLKESDYKNREIFRYGGFLWK
jgi:hypothetical protein